MGYTQCLMPRYKDGKLDAAVVKKHPNFSRVLDIMQEIAVNQKESITESRYFELCDNGKHYERTDEYVTFSAYEQMFFPHNNSMICKTDGEPCDTAVVACYHVASTLMKEFYRFDSDGDDSCDDPNDPYQNARGTLLDKGIQLGDDMMNKIEQ